MSAASRSDDALLEAYQVLRQIARRATQPESSPDDSNDDAEPTDEAA